MLIHFFTINNGLLPVSLLQTRQLNTITYKMKKLRKDNTMTNNKNVGNWSLSSTTYNHTCNYLDTYILGIYTWYFLLPLTYLIFSFLISSSTVFSHASDKPSGT